MTDDLQLDTATLAGARDHARAQVAEVTGAMRTVRVGRRPSCLLVSSPGRSCGTRPWRRRLRHADPARGSVVRIADLDGDACVQLLVFNVGTAERLNPMDTVKVQWQAYLRLGALLCPTWAGC